MSLTKPGGTSLRGQFPRSPTALGVRAVVLNATAALVFGALYGASNPHSKAQCYAVGRRLARQGARDLRRPNCRRSPRQTCDLADRCYRQSKKPVLSRSSGRFAGPEHDDFRADGRAVVEIDDVLVRQADAARRDVGVE
jgi:hypothetical protein